MLPADARRSLFLYNLAFPFLLVVMLPGLLVRMVRRGNFKNKFGQRFGIYDSDVVSRLKGGRRVWIQSISVGETMIALKLARKMKAFAPSLEVVLSVTTSTGFAVANEAREEWIETIYTPLDFAPFVRRAMRLIEPRQLIVIEGMWPNLAAQARENGATLSLIARLSPRSERRYKKFQWLTAPGFRLFHRICVWNDEDARRWISIGAVREQISVTGGIKFDLENGSRAESREQEFRSLLTGMGVHAGRPILLAGSTFPGEERLLAESVLALREKLPDLFLIAVPRHAERATAAAADIRSAGMRTIMRTELPVPSRSDTPCDCLVVNSTGELRDWYRVATVVFIGKSLTAIGGQNPGEPAAVGKPLLFGPNMQNFEAIVRMLLEREAAIQVANGEELTAQVGALLSDKSRRDRMAAAAIDAIAPHQGATARTARELVGL